MIRWIRSWLATIGILLNRRLMRDIRKAQEEFKRGETIPWKTGLTATATFKGEMPPIKARDY